VGSGATFQQEEIERFLCALETEPRKRTEFHLDIHRKRVIVLAGPTASGKSALGMMLANAIGGEIVSADSMQVYRGMDIGTAKVTKEERLQVPHHLINIRDVTEPFNVVDFCHEARHSCQLIHSRDNIPIVVGGSGFYIHSLLYGPPAGPPSVPGVRRAIEQEMEEVGSEAIYERLMVLDPQYASTITSHDKHKIARAMEIIQLTGRKVSKLSWNVNKKLQHYDFRCWFVHRPKENLYRRIEKRCDKMVEEGLLEEVERLEKEGIRTNPTAAQAIGYRQALDYLASQRTKEDYHRFVEDFKRASRHYAKRQFTWFRKEPVFHWLDLDLHDPETAMDIILRDYECWQWEK
jgi:tRNA dimethylallyltransferase